MKINVIRVLGLAALLAASGPAAAQTNGIAWTYVEAAYQSTEFDLGPFGEVDGDGPVVAGSLELLDFVHATASFQRSSLDKIDIPGIVSNLDLGDVDQYSVGIGVHTPVSKGDPTRRYDDRFSAFLDARFIDTDADAGSDGDGWALDAGVRMINFTSWEAIGSAGYENLQGSDGEFTLKGRLLFRLVDHLQLQGGVDWNDNRTQWFLGARYSFPGVGLFRE